MRKRTVRILTGLAVVLVALGIIYAIWVGISAAKLRRAYAALEADGRPMRATDVVPILVDKTENAALLYESAIRLLEAQPAPEENLLEYLGELSDAFAKEPLQADQLSELQDLLKQDSLAHALFAIDQAVERPTCRFELDYDAGVNMLLPHLKGLRDMTRTLGAKARLDAQAGHLDSAWDLALTQLKMADALRNEPILVSQMVRAACIRIACRTVQRLCAIAPPNPQQYDNLQDALRKLDDMAPLVRATDGERLIFGETIFTLPADERRRNMAMLGAGETAPGIVRWFIVQRMSFTPLFVADHATYLRFMHQYAESFERPYSANTMATLETTVEKRARHNLLTSLLVPAIRRVKEIHTQMAAEIRITRVGLMLLRHKNTHNAFPTTLADLSLEGLDDPFTGDPLRYKLETDGFLLYSLATDQEDNQGRPQAPKDEGHHDIAWRFPSGPTQ